GSAASMIFSVQPSSTAAGSPITPAVRVTVHDAVGNVASGFSGSVRVGIATNPAGGTLGGVTTVNASAGVATFATLTINRAATGTGNRFTPPSGSTDSAGHFTATFGSTVAEAKTISAVVGGIAVTQTAAVTVTPAAASALVFTAQPSTTKAGTVIRPPIVVS